MPKLFSWNQGSFPAGTVSQIELAGMIIDGEASGTQDVVINFSILPGNNPYRYGNWAGFWKDNGGCFWDDEPIAWAPVTDPMSRQLQIHLDSLIYGVYWVGYYCVPKSRGRRGAPAATLSFPGVTVGKNPFSSSVLVMDYSAGELTIRYDTPPGNNPARNANAVALCEGDAPAWDGSWLLKQALASTQNSGPLSLPVDLKTGNSYTLAYLNGSGDGNIASCCSFTMDQ